MEATILNTELKSVGIVDSFDSFIWNDKFDQAGDFELCIAVGSPIMDNLKKGYYLWNAESEHVMIIENIVINSDIEEGATYTVSGRSLESLLTRRIVWGNKKRIFKKLLNGKIPKLQDAIKALLDENIIKPNIQARKIPNFIFKESTDEKITELELEAEYFGDELYDVVRKLCSEHNIGFKVTLNDENKFVFELYAGTDRSYAQSTNPYVIFSPDFDNVFSTNYVESDASLKNVTLVAGVGEFDEDEKETIHKTYVVENSGENVGINRREAFTDATSTTTDDGEGGTLSANRYQAILKQKGIDTLIENVEISAFDGEIDVSKTYVYGVDFFMGDIVQIANEYGNQGEARVVELVSTQDQEGESRYPTFAIIQKGVYDAHE